MTPIYPSSMMKKLIKWRLLDPAEYKWPQPEKTENTFWMSFQIDCVGEQQENDYIAFQMALK